MSGLKWESPPAEALRRSGASPYRDIADALREHPGEWARIDREFTESSAKAAAQNIRAGKVQGMSRGEFEAVAHKGAVWVRLPVVEAEQLDDDAAADASSSEPRPADGATVRAWARANDIEIADHGRIPRDVLTRYYESTGEPMPPSLRVVN